MPTSAFDPYAVLGVSRTASATDIRTAYLDLVAQYHPDRHQGNPLEGLAAAKVAELNRAWEILSDSHRRAEYDRDQVRGTGAPFSTVRRAGRKRGPWLYLLGLLLLLPLLIRLVAPLGRLAYRASTQGLATLRGTPVALVAVAIALAIAILLVVRRRHRR